MDWLPRSEADVWLGIADPPMYYDRAGNPIPMIRYTELWGDLDYRRIGETVVADVWRVSTVWLGLDHGFMGPPEIFETMVFELAESHGYVGPSRWTGEGWGYRFHAEAFDGFQARYSTETEAREGHAATVREARELFLPVPV